MKSLSYEEQRRVMVDTQIVARGVSDERVLRAMAEAPRHCFVSPANEDRAYEDHPLTIGCGQTISQPYVVALMTELLELAPTDRVLEIGTGSGYQAAILSMLAAEVISIERHPDLAEHAEASLSALGYDNVTVLTGDGSVGYPECAPYDAIVVTAGSPNVPPALTGQLVIGGRLVCPVGGREVQRLVKLVRKADDLTPVESIKCIFVPLVGEQGWDSDDT